MQRVSGWLLSAEVTMTPAASPSAASAAGYSPGLEGVIAGESAICQVDPDAGLLYRGYPIESFASKVSFEQVAYLLLFGEFPDGGQLATFRAQLAAAASLPDPILSMFQSLPRQTHPMDAIRTGVSMLAGFDPDLNDHSHAANVTKSIRIIARLPTLTAACWRIRSGLEPVAPRADLSCAANLLYMLSGQEPHDWQTQALNTMLNLYAEHEFNASTFAARVTASTLADIYAAITSAIGALKGALHGGA
ncbi:MAG TPA: citrate/2-methylcitrate synthase, partial [Tepidisphaeraceae bacterium]|nr:citrate/2-methylcitrate synthase [Tepidisphaeraceae bacterium]